MRRLILAFTLAALSPALITSPADAGTPQTMRLACEKAKKKLAEVNRRLRNHPNIQYAGDLMRQKDLWEKEIRDNCYQYRRW